jgi:predicted ATPase
MIKHVRIKNFKSLADVSVSFEPVTVLIGRSGTGKTNFVEALRFLRDYLIHRGEGALQDFPGGWPQVLSATANRPLMLSFGVTFNAPGIDGDYEYCLSFQQHPKHPPTHPPSFWEERLSLSSRVLFHQSQGKWVEQPAIVNPPQPGSLLLGALTGLPELTIAHLVLTNGLGCYAFPDTVLLQPVATRRPGEPGLADHGGNYLQALAAITVNLQTWQYPREMAAALRLLNGNVKTVDLQLPNKDRIVVSHQVDGRVLVLDLSQESEGLRRFLAHLIALYQTPPKQTLIFEEPEKGIHPGALAALADQFKACPAAGRGQVILTTHSPELLDHFEPQQVRVVTMEDHVTQIGPVAEEQVEAIREQLLRPGELLTVDPARPAAATPAAG